MDQFVWAGKRLLARFWKHIADPTHGRRHTRAGPNSSVAILSTHYNIDDQRVGSSDGAKLFAPPTHHRWVRFVRCLTSFRQSKNSWLDNKSSSLLSCIVDLEQI